LEAGLASKVLAQAPAPTTGGRRRGLRLQGPTLAQRVQALSEVRAPSPFFNAYVPVTAVRPATFLPPPALLAGEVQSVAAVPAFSYQIISGAYFVPKGIRRRYLSLRFERSAWSIAET